MADKLEEELSEEGLSDYHAWRLGERSALRNILSVVVLTLFAATVIIPFVYMVMMAFKGPSEFGRGRFWPDAMVDLTTLGNKDLVWVRADLTGEQSAAINRSGEVGLAPRSSEFRPGLPMDHPPVGMIFARVISLEKAAMDSPTVTALFQAEDPAHQIINAGAVMALARGGDQKSWVPVSAVLVPRNFSSLMSRLFANYRTLLDWGRLSSGRVVAWLSDGYPRWYINSLFVAFSTVALGLFFDSLAAFAFAKMNFPFRDGLFALLLMTIMIPYPVTLVPSFFLFAKMGLYNTYAALIIPGMVSAFGIFLVRQYMQTIPDEMLDAARVDGASDFSIYRFVVLPAARPILAALAVFRFIWQWNTYLYPLVLTNRDSMKTVQLGLATMQDAYGTVDYGLQMAGAAVAVLPILVVYAIMQKHFISGITLGSVKD
ncbi:MAG: carbohydrate ABC transporter permease [Candidatus Sumerlaeaceae bacterium]|nr:carbohydrate ABC transporter permease [Candidatus Sumerlaeaceae bacterium]